MEPHSSLSRRGFLKSTGMAVAGGGVLSPHTSAAKQQQDQRPRVREYRTLGRTGFEPISATGEPFDPKVHEAVSGPAEAGEGELVVDSELRRGYIMRGRVIRPSLVTVTHA